MRGNGIRRAGLGAAALGAAVLLTASSAAPAAACPATDHPAPHYVALGDSYTSGPNIPDQVDADCGRSNRNYPSQLSTLLHSASFTDASCSGATTAEMWRAEGSNPPQLSALTTRTTLVTVQIGGNDIGFSKILATCVRLAATAPSGSPCRSHYTDPDGTDALATTVGDTGPKVAAVLRGVRERAPHARVVVVGYPDMLPDDGTGCSPSAPFAAGDFAYLRDTEKRLNEMLARQAGAAHAAFTDTYTPSIGHDMCQVPGVRWIEPLAPASPAAAFHPNVFGEGAMARAVLGRLADIDGR